MHIADGLRKVLWWDLLGCLLISQEEGLNSAWGAWLDNFQVVGQQGTVLHLLEGPIAGGLSDLCALGLARYVKVISQGT